MALTGWRGIDTQKPASLSAYGLDSATPPRVYTFSAEPRSLYTFKPPRAPKRGNSNSIIARYLALCPVVRCGLNKAFTQVKTPPPDQAEFLLDAVVRRAEWGYSIRERGSRLDDANAPEQRPYIRGGERHDRCDVDDRPEDLDSRLDERSVLLWIVNHQSDDHADGEHRRKYDRQKDQLGHKESPSLCEATLLYRVHRS